MASPLRLLRNQDVQLLDQIRRGEEEALVTLYRESRRMIVALVTRNRGSVSDAEDILQEALIVLWNRVRRGNFEHQAKLQTFLYATAQNMWRRQLAHRRRESPDDPSADLMASDEPSPLVQMMELEEAALVKQGLSRLTNVCRDLLVLFYWEELSLSEIASRMGFANAQTVKAKKYQCKKALEAIVRGLASDHD